MGYSELQFILAEAVARGWISESVQCLLYKWHTGLPLQFSDYNTTPIAAPTFRITCHSPLWLLQAGTAIQQIITQKYISMFMNVGWQPLLHEYTCVPAYQH